MKFSFHTLGCKVNQFETNSVKEIVLQKGYSICDESPDIFVINTCTVTAVSDKKNVKLIKKVKKENPNALVAVFGCFAQVSPDKAQSIEGVDVVCGTSDRDKIVDMCVDSYKNQTKHTILRDTKVKNEFEILPISRNSDRTRELIKVQDGCNLFCSYCIIPFARGRSRSIPLETVIDQVQTLSDLKTQEIIVTGIEIASYGLDVGSDMITLIETLCIKFPHIRFRLGSLEPRVITDDLCKRLSIFNNLNPHFHLSMQSGSDTVLKRMNRKYDTKLFLNVCNLLRKYFKTPSITTDLIVGFPGETEEEFAQTVDFIQKCNFSSMHVFPYSIREGTRASTMENQIDINIKNKRAKIAGDIAKNMEHAYLESFIGKHEDIIIESPTSKGDFQGHTKFHFAITCTDTDYTQGEKVSILITDVKNGKVFGKRYFLSQLFHIRPL